MRIFSIFDSNLDNAHQVLATINKRRNQSKGAVTAIVEEAMAYIDAVFWPTKQDKVRLSFSFALR